MGLISPEGEVNEPRLSHPQRRFGKFHFGKAVFKLLLWEHGMDVTFRRGLINNNLIGSGAITGIMTVR